jgi:hypothetical protein
MQQQEKQTETELLAKVPAEPNIKERKTDRQIDRFFKVLRLVLRYLVALYLIFQHFYYHSYALKAPPYSLYFSVLGLFVFYGDEMKMLFVMYQEHQDKRQEKRKNMIIAEWQADKAGKTEGS